MANKPSNNSNSNPPPHLGTVCDYDTAADLRLALEAGLSSPCSQLDWQTYNLDRHNSQDETLTHELRRLLALKSFHILDSDFKPYFERLTGLGQRIFDVPICLVSLVDLGRQWFASNRGLGDVRETPRKVAFCAHAILSEMDTFVVPDALEDDRFRENSLVTGKPHIRFYAGAPLVTKCGYKIGTFCIIDSKPHPNGLTIDEKNNLKDLAALVVDQLEGIKAQRKEDEMDKSKLIACMAHDLITPLTSIQLNVGLLAEDESLQQTLSKAQNDTLKNTQVCVDIMSNICQYSIQSFRSKQQQLIQRDTTTNTSSSAPDNLIQNSLLHIRRFVTTLKYITNSYPKTVPITIHIQNNVPTSIKTDSVCIFRSALILLTNACRFTEKGSIQVQIYRQEYDHDHDCGGSTFPKSEQDCKSNYDSLVFECIDTGKGISPKDTEHLFSARGGLYLSQKSDKGGLGLGLVSLTQCVTVLGGKYGYKPRLEAEGSIFWFSIPILPLDKEEEEEKELSVSPYLTSKRASNLTVATAYTTVVKYDTVRAEECCTTTIERASKRSKLNNSLTDESTLVVSHKSYQRDGETSSQQKVEDSPNPIIQQQDAAVSSQSKNSNTIIEANILNTPPTALSASSSSSSSLSSSSSSSNRIKCALIIDDSKTIRKVLHAALKRFGFHVVEAENGLQGLEEMKCAVFDIVLCDLLMPVMGGIDCVYRYREWEKSNRTWFKQYIVGISAHADENDSIRSISLGMDKFLQKPLPIQKLRDLVESHEISTISQKIDGLCDDSNAIPYILHAKNSDDMLSLPPSSGSLRRLPSLSDLHDSSVSDLNSIIDEGQIRQSLLNKEIIP